MERKIMKFAVWMRNGVCFCFTWLMLLYLAGSYLLGRETMSVVSVGKLLVFVIGGVFFFTMMFSGVLFGKVSFIAKLTGFMILFGGYESVCFYWIGIFQENRDIIFWGIFAAIILVFYFISIGIYHIYSGKKEIVYTQKLREYQENRKNGRKVEL